VFREKVAPFAEEWKKWWMAVKEQEHTREQRMEEDRRRAESDARFRNRQAMPDGDGWEWAWWCRAEFVEQNGQRYSKMPACLGAEYVEHLLRLAAEAKRQCQGLPQQNPRRRKCADGAKRWAGYAREVKAELDRKARKPTGDLLLTHNWWQYWPIFAGQGYKAGKPTQEHQDHVARIERIIGEHLGCWRQRPQIPGNIVDEWFPVDDRSPGTLPSLTPVCEQQRRYVTLASIHDTRLPHPKIAGENISSLVLTGPTWSRLRDCSPLAYDTRQTFIRSALRHVEAELSERPRNNPFGFGRRHGDKSKPQFVFKNEGATWRIIYAEHETTVKDSLGMKYIRYLLEHPNTRIECRDIERACSVESPEGGRRLDSAEAIEADLHTNGYDLKKLDNWDAKDIKSALNKLKADIEDTDNPTRKAELQKDADHLADYLRKSLNRHGQPRSVDEREQARSRVQKAINAAKKAIKRADEHIGDHFEAVKGDGAAYMYKPSSEIPWTLE